MATEGNAGRPQRRAYIGSFTSAGGRGITTARIGAGSGALGSPRVTASVPDPSYLALSPDGAVLYAVSEQAGEGRVAAYSLRNPDAPVPLGPAVPTGGGEPTHLCLLDGWLLIANYASGSLSSLLVSGSDGRPGEIGHILRHQGCGPHPERQKGPHAHAVLPGPGSDWVLGVDLGGDAVRVCALDRATGRLSTHRRIALPAGSGPRHLTFHPSGRLAYLVNELASTITTLAWDAAAGALEPLATVATLPPEEADGTPNYPSEAVVSPDGRFLWVANRGHDSIALFTLDADAGRPRPAGTVPCGGHWPRDLALDPVGGRLYACNERSGDVTWFEVDPDSGQPHRAGSLPVPAASCVVFA